VAALLAYLAITAIVFRLYPFIPESDPYLYLQTLQNAIKLDLAASSLSPRPLFTVLTASLSLMGEIVPYTLFKYGLPLLGFIMLLPIYAQARRYTKNKLILFWATLLPLTIPIILLESVIVRPQLLLMFVFPGILYLLSRAIARQSVLLAVLVLALSAIMIKFHELSFALVFIALVTVLALLWPAAKKQPKVAAAFVLLSALAIYPHTGTDTLVGMVIGIGRVMLSRLVPFHPQVWFLSNYTNIDGVEVGWPGISWLFYYGYNLGVAIPLLIGAVAAVIIMKKHRFRRPKFDQLPIVASIVTFFSIAEILPRLNVPFLPDRAWSFLLISTCLALPGFMARFEKYFTRTSGKVFVSLAIMLSIGAGFGIAYAKQGWLTENEYQAALFLKKNTAPDSVVVTQGGNGQLVEYFGERALVAKDVFTVPKPADQIVSQLAGLETEKVAAYEGLVALRGQLVDALNNEHLLSHEASAEEIESLRKERTSIYAQLTEVDRQIALLAQLKGPEHSEMYVLYSQDKFTSLYGQRTWWRNLNYADASLAVFEDERYFTQVYANEGVKIWKLKR
jgi:hypothetical protein